MNNGPLENYCSDFKVLILSVFLPLKTPSVARLDGINPPPTKTTLAKLYFSFFSTLQFLHYMWVAEHRQAFHGSLCIIITVLVMTFHRFSFSIITIYVS